MRERFVVLCLLLLACSSTLLGCTSNGDDGSYPIRPGNIGGVGGGSGSGGGAIDAGPRDGGVATVGRICLTDDLRYPDRCASTGAGGITVQRGTASVLTTPDGKFDLPPATAVGDWRVSRADLVISAVPYSAGAAVLIPVITTVNFALFLNNNGIVLADGQGSLLVASRAPNGLPKASVQISTSPVGVPGVYYDGPSAKTWSRDPTGTQAVAIAPGLLAGTYNVAGAAPDGSRSLPAVPVVANALSFVVLDFLK
jgi:hypothetical protein